MFDFINFTADKIQLFMLLMIRASGLFLAAPIIGHPTIPKQVKVGLVILFAIVAMPGLGGEVLTPAVTVFDLAAMALSELMVGLLIGFFFSLLFKAVEMAGAMAGFQVGLAITAAFDPNAGGTVSVIGRLWIILASLIFLTINGHHLIIGAFNDSYRLIPPGGMVIDGSTAELVIKYTSYVFVLAIKFVAPVLVTLILMDIALGTVAKMMPTMNIFIVGFPLKIGMGIIVVAMSLPIFSYVLEKSTSYFDHAVDELLMTMGSI